MNDNQLLRCCLQGDSEAYKNIVNKYRTKTMAMAFNILGNREDAEDVCQEAFIRAFQNLDKFDFDRDFKHWLYSILYNRCIDHLRKKRRFYQIFNRLKWEELQLLAAQKSDPSPTQSLRLNFLNILSPKERIAVVLWANEGYTSDEIASVLSCSSSTARVHLLKARKKIKSFMEKENVSLQNC